MEQWGSTPHPMVLIFPAASGRPPLFEAGPENHFDAKISGLDWGTENDTRTGPARPGF
jgi:hypothetical protein